MTEQYDVVVIGGGPVGNAMASGLQAQGKSVLIVEVDLWGGTCPNRGCDPKRILLSAVEAQQAAQHLQHQGLTGTPTIDVELYPMTKPPGILAKLKSKKASNNVLMTNNVFFIKAPFSFKDITSIH